MHFKKGKSFFSPKTIYRMLLLLFRNNPKKLLIFDFILQIATHKTTSNINDTFYTNCLPCGQNRNDH